MKKMMGTPMEFARKEQLERVLKSLPEEGGSLYHCAKGPRSSQLLVIVIL